MKIKKGEFYRYSDGPKVFGPNGDDFAHDDAIRVIVRDAEPRRTIKPSEALAWLMGHDDWTIQPSEILHGGVYVRVNEAGGPDHAHGPTLTKAIIALRKALRAKGAL